MAQHALFFQRFWDGRTAPPALDALPALPPCDKAMLRANQAAHSPSDGYLAALVEAVRGTRGRLAASESPEAMLLAAKLASLEREKCSRFVKNKYDIIFIFVLRSAP